MENLNFYIRNTNMRFTWEPKDLFYMHNDYIYYLVVYKPFNIDDSDKDIEWRLGLQFLQKYSLTFDRNDRIVYYYSKSDNNDEYKNKKKTIKMMIKGMMENKRIKIQIIQLNILA